MHSDRQRVFRLSHELEEAVERDAKRSGWSFAAQVRYELMERRGMLPKPYLPQPPSHDRTTRNPKSAQLSDEAGLTGLDGALR